VTAAADPTEPTTPELPRTPRDWSAALPHDDPRHLIAHHFLNEEAAILDAARWRLWLELLAPEITYLMPVRVTTMSDTDPTDLGNHARMDHLAEDLHSLTKRVERLSGGHAWTEDPPSRTRHLVTNVRTFPTGDGPGDRPGIEVHSALLLFRSRGDDKAPEFMSAGRRDLLTETPGGWRLARREITVDEAVLRTQNLAILL